MDTTDTNQASEDELKVLLESNGWKFYEELNGFRKESKYTIPMFSTDQQANYDELSAGNYYELKQVIQSAIRTEKLKLLAEVRERVIGEDYDIPAEMEKVGRDFQKLDAIAKTGGLLNKFKADLRTKLTKLEAEL